MAFINKISPVYSHWHTDKLKFNPRMYKGVCGSIWNAKLKKKT